MSKGDPSRELDRDLAGCAAAHQRLLEAIDGLTDDQARQPSLLPDWSVGHVLSHIARNAESFVRLLRAGAAGELGVQYPDGAAARNADIAAGAGRSAAELVADVRSTAWELEQTWAMASGRTWDGLGRMLIGDVPLREVPRRRWREVEVHHADLGLGYTFADMPSGYVRLELSAMSALWASRKPLGSTELPDEVLARPEGEQLAWLFGRADVAGVGPAGIY